MADEITPNNPTPQMEAPQEPIPAPEPVSEHIPIEPTAQMGGNEPLATQPEPIEEPEIPEVEPVEKTEPKSQTPTEATPPPVFVPVPVVIPTRNQIKEILAKAQFAIQTRKQKKKEKIMTLFAKRTKITNDEVEKLLHVSDSTATRYLEILEKENKIKQNSKTGKAVSYSKI